MFISLVIAPCFALPHFAQKEKPKSHTTSELLSGWAILSNSQQGKRGSNPHLRFWRPLLYHWTIPLCFFVFCFVPSNEYYNITGFQHCQQLFWIFFKVFSKKVIVCFFLFFYTVMPPEKQITACTYCSKKNVPRHILAPSAVACDMFLLRASAHHWHVSAFLRNRKFQGISYYIKIPAPDILTRRRHFYHNSPMASRTLDTPIMRIPSTGFIFSIFTFGSTQVVNPSLAASATLWAAWEIPRTSPESPTSPKISMPGSTGLSL